MASPASRLKLKYCWHVAAAFGKVRRTRGEAANLCRRSRTPFVWSNSIVVQLIASSRAGPRSFPTSLVAQYLRFSTGVALTYQQTSRVYLRHDLAPPSQTGTFCSFSDDISPEKQSMAKMACKGPQSCHWGVQIQTGKKARPKGRGSSGRSIPLRPAKGFRSKL